MFYNNFIKKDLNRIAYFKLRSQKVMVCPGQAANISNVAYILR